MKIAQALLLRKQLEAKVKQLEPIKLEGDNGLFETKINRRKLSDEVDEVKFEIPKISLKEITAEYDKYATALRKLDASIQEANWKHEVKFNDTDNPMDKQKQKKK